MAPIGSTVLASQPSEGTTFQSLILENFSSNKETTIINPKDFWKRVVSRGQISGRRGNEINSLTDITMIKRTSSYRCFLSCGFAWEEQKGNSELFIGSIIDQWDNLNDHLNGMLTARQQFCHCKFRNACSECSRDGILNDYFQRVTTYHELPKVLVLHLDSSEKEEFRKKNSTKEENYVWPPKMEGMLREDKPTSRSAIIELKKVLCSERFNFQGFLYDPVVLFVENRFRSDNAARSTYMVLVKYGTSWYLIKDEIVTEFNYVVKEAVIMVWAVRAENELLS